jgi:phage tail protein X
MVADHFRPLMADPRGCGNRGDGVVKRSPRISREPAGNSHHRPVRHLDTADSMLLAHVYAGTEAVVRATHPAADILRIAEPAQRHGFQLRCIGLPGQVETGAMFAQAAVDVPLGEAQVAAQEVDARPLGREMMTHGDLFGLPKIGEGPIEIIGDPLHGCRPDPCLAPLDVIDRRIQG